jgi:hypothetical protein
MARPETARHRAAFEAWYAANRDFKKTSENLGTNLKTLYGWSDRFDWQERAAERDGEAQRTADKEAARRTADFLKAQQQAGQLLRIKGVRHYAAHDVADGREAIAAIKAGIELERQALGLPDWIVRMLNADPATLTAELAAMDARRRAALGDLAGDSTDDGTDGAEPVTDAPGTAP